MVTDDIICAFPHALGSEKLVLSTLMREPHRIDEAAIVPEIFYLPAHRILLADIQKNSNQWELVSAVQRLHDNGLLDSVGGPSGVTDIFTYAPNNAYFDQHIRILRDRMSRRMALEVAESIKEAAFDCSEENWLNALSEPVTAVFDAASGINPIHDLKWLSKEFLNNFEAKIAGVELPMGIPFGIPLIDNHLRGLHPQHYGIISGRSGSGKSTLAVEVWGNLAENGAGGLYLILERTETSAFTKAVIQAAKLHHAAVVDPLGYAKSQNREKLSKEELVAIRMAVTKLNESNLHIRKPQSRGIQEIIAEIRRYVRVHGVKVVFVDQIGLIRGERFKGETAEMELRRTSNTLQELSDELGITIVVLCQENNDGETKNARAIEEDADWWLSIVQERNKQVSDFGQHKHILIAKDSHNGNGGVRLPLILDKATLRFVYGLAS